MAVTTKLLASAPANGLGSSASGGSPIDYLSDTVKGMLSTSSYTPAQSHTIKSDVTNEVANGNGYTTGGVTLGSKTVGLSSLTYSYDAADLAWTSCTFSTAVCSIYDDTVGTPVKPLIQYIDFGGTQTLAGGNLTIVLNASGLFFVTVA